MAFPALTRVNSTNASTTSHTVSLPASISAGNRLLVLFTARGNQVVTFPAGWNILGRRNVGNGWTWAAYWKIADGTEGSSITVTTGAANTSNARAWKITGTSSIPELFFDSTNQTTANPNPPAATPTWGSADNYYLAVQTWDSLDGSTNTGYPTNYGLDQETTVFGTVGIATAGRELAASSDDPGTFTLSASRNTWPITFVFKPDTSPDLKFDAATESIRTATTDPWTFNHTPVGTPKAVVLAAIHNTSATDQIVSVTYGGVAMSHVISAADSAGEPGRASLYFLGSGIPTGTQTVSIDLTGTVGDDYQFVLMTFTASGNTEVISGSTGVLEGDQANPTLTPAKGGRAGLSIVAGYSGLGAPRTDVGQGFWWLADNDFGNQDAEVLIQVDESTNNLAINRVAASDDIAWAGMAIGVVQAGTPIDSDVEIDAAIRVLATSDVSIDAIVRALATSDRAIDATIRAIITSDRAIDAAIRTSITSDVTFDAEIVEAAVSDVEIDAVIRALVNSDLAIDAAIQNQITSDVEIDAVIRQPISSDVEFDAVIRAAITSDVTFAADVGGRLSADLTIDAAVRNVITSDVGFDAPLTTTITSDLEFDAEIHVGLEHDLVIDAGIREFVSSDLSVDAQVQAFVSSDLEIDAAVSEEIASDVEFDAGVREFVSSDVTFAADITQATGVAASPITIDAPVAAFIASDLEIDARVGDVPVEEPEFGFGVGGWIRKLPPVYRTITSDLTIDAPIAGTVRKDLRFSAAITRRISSTKRIDAPVRKLIDVEMSIDAPVYSFYDWNRDILLMEIDPDLPLSA